MRAIYSLLFHRYPQTKIFMHRKVTGITAEVPHGYCVSLVACPKLVQTENLQDTY